jgi:hypothetical protein
MVPDGEKGLGGKSTETNANRWWSSHLTLPTPMTLNDFQMDVAYVVVQVLNGH